jgi:hypothetical protein
LTKGNTTIERCAASAGTFVVTLAGRFAMRNHHAPYAITHAASAAASRASAARFLGERGSGNRGGSRRSGARDWLAEALVSVGSTFAAAIAAGVSA